jgi:hypothetical protein
MADTSIEVDLYTIFLGGIHIACYECDVVSHEIEIGIFIDDSESEMESIGVIKFDSCQHLYMCGCLTDIIALAIEHHQQGVLSIHDICKLDGCTCPADDEDASDPS